MQPPGGHTGPSTPPTPGSQHLPVASASCSKSMTLPLGSLALGQAYSLPNEGADSKSTPCGSRVPGNPTSPGPLLQPRWAGPSTYLARRKNSLLRREETRQRQACRTAELQETGSGRRLRTMLSSVQGSPHGRRGLDGRGHSRAAWTCCLGHSFSVHRAASNTNRQVEGRAGREPEALWYRDPLCPQPSHSQEQSPRHGHIWQRSGTW